MNAIDGIIRFFFALLFAAFHFVIGLLATLDLWVRGGLSRIGLPDTFQALFLILAAIALLLLLVRFVGGIMRIVLLVLVILWAIEVLNPAIHFT